MRWQAAGPKREKCPVLWLVILASESSIRVKNPLNNTDFPFGKHSLQSYFCGTCRVFGIGEHSSCDAPYAGLQFYAEYAKMRRKITGWMRPGAKGETACEFIRNRAGREAVSVWEDLYADQY